ncbi:MAG: LysM peptidoglycan-binding domain-containing protein [Chloroflexota bacterium]|nr:LysM peptidoglycan-binding domain-containing protein [Chloroflexota bacterium]
MIELKFSQDPGTQPGPVRSCWSLAVSRLRQSIPARVGSHALRALLVPVAIALALAVAGCDSPGADNLLTQAQPTVMVIATVPGNVRDATASPTVVEAARTSTVVAASSALTAEASGTPLPLPSARRPALESTYIVQQGDTLSGLALQFGTTVGALMQANGLASADLIYNGQALKVTPAELAKDVPTRTLAPQQKPSSVALASTALPKIPQNGKPFVTLTAPTVSVPTVHAAADAHSTTVVVNGILYDAYNQAATKQHQWYHYSCEFDAAWVVLKTYGFDVSMDEQLAIVGVDKSVEPYYKETSGGIFIYGGDILNSYSGSYATNFLARTTGSAMRRVFEHYGLRVTPVHDQVALEAALRRGELVWIKTTADFKPGKPSTWVMPGGATYQTVLGNDHAAVVMGYNSDGALIRDVLGPTSTNWQRQYEYLVPWPKFLTAWAQQSYDGLAVTAP